MIMGRGLDEGREKLEVGTDRSAWSGAETEEIVWSGAGTEEIVRSGAET